MSKLNGVLILECIDKADPGSEGHFLSHMFKIMGVPSQYVEIRTKEQFIGMLMANPFDGVHIATHGSYEGKKFDGFWTPDEEIVGLSDFQKNSLQGKTVVATACRSGAKHFAKSFVKRTSAKYYIAPAKRPKFHNAIYFAHWFYHNVIVLKLSPKEAITKYRAGYKNPPDFLVFHD